MTILLIHRDLLDWQWKGYAQAHQDRANLLIHLATVPLFWVGALLLLVAIATVMPVLAAGLPVLWLVALVAQAKGHRREVTAAQPFLGRSTSSSVFLQSSSSPSRATS